MAEPYYQDERVEIWHGDCRKLLARWSAEGRTFDHCITDPPYSEHVHGHSKTNAGTDGASGGADVDFGFAHLTTATRVAVSSSLRKLVKRWCLVFSDLESAHLWREDLGIQAFEFVRTGAWFKGCPSPQITGDRPGSALEAITICHPVGKKKWNGGGRHNVWEARVPRKSDGRVHPNEKPLDLLRQLVLDFTDAGDSILDPFAGSGSLGRAAASEGRRAVLVESDDRWCAEAASRFGAAVPDRGNQLGMRW